MVHIKLNKISNLQNGFAFKSNDYVEKSNTINFRMSQIRPGGKVDLTHNPKYLPDKYAEKYEDYLLHEGDVVIAMTDMASDTKILGVPTIIKQKVENLLLNQRVGKLFDINTKIIEIPYLRYILTAPQIYSQYKKLGKGGVQINLGKSDILGVEIPIYSLLEQKAIVAKIEQLFSELDNAVANLKTAKAKLKIYRQAVLKKAFEGELTCEWREKQTNLPTADELLEQIKKEREVHYKQQLEEWKQAVKEWEENGQIGKKPSRISKPKILDEVTKEEIDTYGKLPISWKWERFNNVTHKIGDIDHKMPKPSENGFPYLSTGNIYADGTMDFENAKTISEEDYKRLALKIKPEKNDIIFPRYGTIGRNILVNIDKKFLVSYSCAIIKNINEYINAKYAHYYSLSPVIKKEIKKYTVQTTQANIGIASIENFVFPLCSFEEQNQIVQEIESRLSVCDKIEETIETTLAKSEALRQSILKKAFEGKLLNEKELENIKNHPEYESAEALLKRIKEER